MSLWLEIFMAFCSGVTALAIIVGAVVYTIKREMNPILVRLELLEEEHKTRMAFEGKLLGKLDIIKDQLADIKLSYVSDADLEKQQKLCPARMRAMEDLKKGDQ
jgi:hypothetical protein